MIRDSHAQIRNGNSYTPTLRETHVCVVFISLYQYYDIRYIFLLFY